MDKKVKKAFKNLNSKNDLKRMRALKEVMEYTDKKVEWIYEEWNNLVNKLDEENSFQRSIAIIVLCNLAKSDKEKRMEAIIVKLLSHTKDEKFITSRQCILNVWKVAIESNYLEAKVINHLNKRFKECEKEKHYNLIRTDIITAMYRIYQNKKDKKILDKINKLILSERQLKYRKKYKSLLI